MHAGQVPGAGQVHIAGPARRAGRRLVSVHRRSRLEHLPDPVHEPARLDQRGGPAADPGHPPRRDGDPGQLAQQQRGPVDRDVVAGGQVRGLRAGLRPEAGAGTDIRGQLARGDHPAAGPFLSLRHVLGDPRRRRRGDVGDLMTALRQHRCPGQARTAPAGRRRREREPLVRVSCQVHRRPRFARLLARPPLPPVPQRPVGALFGDYSATNRRGCQVAGHTANTPWNTRVHPRRSRYSCCMICPIRGDFTGFRVQVPPGHVVSAFKSPGFEILSFKVSVHSSSLKPA